MRDKLTGIIDRIGVQLALIGLDPETRMAALAAYERNTHDES